MVANTSIEMVFRMPFLIFSNVDVGFLDKKLIWKIYSVAETLLITKRVQIINWKKFAKAVLDLNKKVFIIYIATITSKITIHLERKAWIALLKVKKAPVSIPTEYLDFTNIFFVKLATVLSEHTKINTHAMDVEEGK